MQLTKRTESTGNSGMSSPFIGFSDWTVIGVNMSLAEKAALYGKSYDPDAEPEEGKKKQEEPTYEKKDNEGNDQIIVEFYLKANIAPHPIKTVQFYITDKKVYSKEKEGKETTAQWVNQLGDSTYAVSKDKMMASFRYFTDFGKETPNDQGAKICRQAIEGEAALYGFVKAWVSKPDYKKNTTNLLLDIKRLFNNPIFYVKEVFQPLIDQTNKIASLEATVQTLITAPKEEQDKSAISKAFKDIDDLKKELFTAPVVTLAYVQSKENKDGELKHHQKFYRDWLPYSFAVQNGKNWENPVTIQAIASCIETGNWSKYKKLEKYIKKITEGEFQLKDIYAIQMLDKFNPDTFQASSGVLFRDESGDDTDHQYESKRTYVNGEEIDQLPF